MVSHFPCGSDSEIFQEKVSIFLEMQSKEPTKKVFLFSERKIKRCEFPTQTQTENFTQNFLQFQTCGYITWSRGMVGELSCTWMEKNWWQKSTRVLEENEILLIVKWMILKAEIDGVSPTVCLALEGMASKLMLIMMTLSSGIESLTKPRLQLFIMETWVSGFNILLYDLDFDITKSIAA